LNVIFQYLSYNEALSDDFCQAFASSFGFELTSHIYIGLSGRIVTVLFSVFSIHGTATLILTSFDATIHGNKYTSSSDLPSFILMKLFAITQLSSGKSKYATQLNLLSILLSLSVTFNEILCLSHHATILSLSSISNITLADSTDSSFISFDTPTLSTLNFIVISQADQSDFILKFEYHSNNHLVIFFELLSENTQLPDISHFTLYSSQLTRLLLLSNNSRNTSTSLHFTNCVDEGVNLISHILPGLTEIFCVHSIPKASVKTNL